MWSNVVNSLPETFRDHFYKNWDSSLKGCRKCKISYPKHKLFYTPKGEYWEGICKKCCGKEFINEHIARIFKECIPVDHKFCNGCNNILPLSEEYFNKNSNSSTGFYARCKLCRGFKSYGIQAIGINAKLSKESLKKCKYCNKVKDLSEFEWSGTTRRNIYCRDCKEIHLDYEREIRAPYTEEQKKNKREYDKKYYIINKNNKKLYYTTWKVNGGQELRRLSNHKRESKKRELLHDLTLEQWEYTKVYFNNSCAYCGMSQSEHKLIYNQRLHQEHIIPVSKDGVYSNFNIIPSCYKCNDSKNNMDLEDFLIHSDRFTTERYIEILDYILHTV